MHTTYKFIYIQYSYTLQMYTQSKHVYFHDSTDEKSTMHMPQHIFLSDFLYFKSIFLKI